MGCGCGSGKNQTHQTVFEYFEKSYGEKYDVKISRAEIGTGTFMIPAPEVGILEFKTIRVPNLSYIETVKRGQNCVSFSFVPEKMIPFEKLKAISCGGGCMGPRGCTNGCLCNGLGEDCE